MMTLILVRQCLMFYGLGSVPIPLQFCDDTLFNKRVLYVNHCQFWFEGLGLLSTSLERTFHSAIPDFTQKVIFVHTMFHTVDKEEQLRVSELLNRNSR